MAKSKWISFGAYQPLERASKAQAGPVPTPSTSPHSSPSDAKKFGFENFANICYANSVLQTLYFCAPFRDLLLQDAGHTVSSSSSPLVVPTPDPPPPSGRRKSERKVAEPSSSSQSAGIPIPSSAPTLYSALQSLFLHISTSPGDKGTVAPRAFIDKLKELNELFRSTMHQDAHEFLNYLLNQIVEEIEIGRASTSNITNGDDFLSSIQTVSPTLVVTTVNGAKSGSHSDSSLVHKLFEGVLTSETRCLTCETVSCRDESFLDLSVDIDQNSSLTACLRQFSASEMLCQKNKFFCDSCCDLQEAEKRMKIKKLPNVLALHLKRFKYQEDLGRYIKLTYRVAFPLELRLFNTVDDLDDVDRLYNLFAIVVHIGNGPHHGHYISIIKTTGSWFVFDDDNVLPIPESDIPRYFGDSNSGSAYILYYQAADIDLINLGLRSPESPEANATTASDKPQNSSQHSPAVPPGLESVSTSDLPLLPRHILAEHSSLPTTPGLLTIPQSSDSTPQPPNSAPIITPTSLGRQIINTIRRAPSMSATRSSPIATSNNSERKSPSDKSPRLPASLAGFIADSSHEVPPVPPLPPNILASPPQTSPPTFAASIGEPQKEEKGKEREKPRTGGNWFSKKRKSLRLGDKGGRHEAVLTQIPPSPSILAEDSSHSHSQPQPIGWFNRSNSSTAVPKSQPVSRKGTSFDALDPHVPGSSTHDRRPYGLEDSWQPSRSSSPSSSSLLIVGQGLVGGATTEPSPSMSTSSVIVPDHPLPGQNSSFISFEQSRSGANQKKNDDSNFPYHPVSSPESTSNHHPPPPLLLNRLDPHRFLPGNGYVPTSEWDMTPADKVHAMEERVFTPLRRPSVDMPQDGHSVDHFHDPRLPARKLSLATPILAFGRKDREREKR